MTYGEIQHDSVSSNKVIRIRIVNDLDVDL